MTGQDLVLELMIAGRYTKVMIANALTVPWGTVSDWAAGTDEPTPEQHAPLEDLLKR